MFQRGKTFAVAMQVCRAFLAPKTLASMVPPCAVNAKGKAFPGRFVGYVITFCDDIVSHSSSAS